MARQVCSIASPDRARGAGELARSSVAVRLSLPGKEIVVPNLDELQRDSERILEWIDYSSYDTESTWLLREEVRFHRRHHIYAPPDASAFSFYLRC